VNRTDQIKKALNQGAHMSRRSGSWPVYVSTILWLFAMLILSGCSTAQDDRVGSARSPEDKGTARQSDFSSGKPAGAERDKRPVQDSAGPIGGNKKGVQPTSSGTVPRAASSQAIRGPVRGPVVEKISGYMTPAEYFIIPSVNFSEAVVAVSLPSDYARKPKKTYPLVIVFGGAGECAKAPRSGALAWMHYYKTDEAVKALERKRLREADFRGLVKPPQLSEFNGRLKAHPYEGIILACPSSPLLSPQFGTEFPDYEAYIMEDLLPALQKRYRVAADSIGVDGVSMGGSRSMYYGFKYPEVFSSIGSVQGAFGPYIEVYRDLIQKKGNLIKKRSVQLVTSDGDVMATSVEKLHKLLLSNGITHRYYVLTGPHDYIFNQGPGALALLMFHSEALRGSAKTRNSAGGQPGGTPQSR